MLTGLVKYSYLFMLIVGVMLPSDANHGFLAPKSLAFLMAAFLFTLYFLTRSKIVMTQGWAALVMLMGLLFGGIWMGVSQLQETLLLARPFDQFKILIITLFVPLSSWYLVKGGLFKSQTVFKAVIVGHFFYCFLKVLVILLHLVGVINLWSLIELTQLRFMSMQITEGLSRIQTSTDIITPFLVYFLLQSDKLGLNFSKKFKCIFLAIAAISIFFSFSRLLIFAFGLSIFLHSLTLNHMQQIRLWLVSIVVMMMSSVLIGPEQFLEAMERRFFSQETNQSDIVRRQQTAALLNACDERPLFGFGLGGYAPECIRDTTLFHSYEVQWVAFLMQFGLVGVIFIVLSCSLLALNWILPPINASRIGFFLLFCLWLISGFTNPFLISLTSGIIYAIFLLASEITKTYSPTLTQS